MPKYTPDNPYVLFLRPDEDVMGMEHKLNNWIQTRGGVAVWRAALLEWAGRSVLTPARSDYYVNTTGERRAAEGLIPPGCELHGDVPTVRPGWQWYTEPEEIITDINCISIRAPEPAQFVQRKYLDLELFSLAAARVGYTIQVRVSTGMMRDYIDHMAPEELVEFLASHPKGMARAEALVLYHGRVAHNPAGYHIGHEEFEATLPIVAFEEGDAFHGPGTPNGLAAWLVRVDEGALNCQCTDHPEEPKVVEGHVGPDGEFHEGEMRPEDDDVCTEAYQVDGEVLTRDEYEDLSTYMAPDDDFVFQEMSALLESILEVGPRRRYNREVSAAEDEPVWEVVNSYGEEL